MGSCGLTVDSWEGLTEPSDLHKMTPFVILSLVASAFAAPQLPAGLTAAACPNYPYCDATGGFLAVPDVPGAADVIAAQEAIIRELESPLSPVLRPTPLLRPLFSSSPVLGSPLTPPLSTLCSSARAGFLRDLAPATLLTTSLSRR